MAIENLIRDTQYDFYSIGAVDPNFVHLWGFETAAQRTSFLQLHHRKTTTGNKYWRVGNTIRINATTETAFSFEASWKFDYVKITNRPGQAQEQVYYAFIVDRKYININLTELALSVDWIQTFYFNQQGQPFWNCSGYGVATSKLSVLPPRGIGAEYPVLSKQTLWKRSTSVQSSGNVGFIVYSSIIINALYDAAEDEMAFQYPFDNGYPQYSATLVSYVFMGSAPYVINSGNMTTNFNILRVLNNALNTSGQLGSITGIFAVPAEFLPSAPSGTQYTSIYSVLGSDMPLITINVPDASTLFQNAGLSCINPVLKGYDYTYISLSNMQGEEQIYHYEDFNGSPVFRCGVTLSAGYPVMNMIPVNYKYSPQSGSTLLPSDPSELFIMKQTNPPQCSMQSDNYAIWQAQNRNSIQASIDAGKLSISNAKEAQQKTGGIATMLDNLFDNASDAVGDLTQSLGITLPDSVSDALETAGYGGLNSILKMGMLGSFGLEASYTYKQQVAVAEQALKATEAQFKDMSYLPATAYGSNAYGDLMANHQYGFMITVIAPTAQALLDLDRINESGGHICKGLISCTKSRQIFDYYRILEAKVENDVESRPQFVNRMMASLFADGLYLWWTQQSGDIDTVNFAHPYAVTNGSVE